MGLSVWNQVDNDKYFSLSTIDKKVMQKHGLNMTIKALRDLARKTPPHAEIYTGQSKLIGWRKATKIWRYEDFKGCV